MKILLSLQFTCTHKASNLAECSSKSSNLAQRQFASRAALLFLQLLIPTTVAATANQVLALPIDEGSNFSINQTTQTQASTDLSDSLESNADTSVRYVAQALSSSNRTAYYGYNSPRLRLGDEGPDVTFVQQRLQSLGYYISIDGVFGSETDAALRRFQQDRGLHVDGVVGEDTWLALNQGTAPGTPNPPGYPYPPTSPTYPNRLGYCPIEQYASVKRYIVLVPSDNAGKLAQIRQYPSFRGAFIARSPLGSYIQAGACADLSSANSRTGFLRSRGFKDAQVRYF